MRKSFSFALLLLTTWAAAPFLCAQQPEARTWTSVSGATVEAEYVTMERGAVVLRGADGGLFNIRPDLLSTADQNYVREQLGMESTPVAVKAGTPEAPALLHTRDIPGLTLASPESASFIGLQPGQAAAGTVYLILDRSTGEAPADTVYLYNPSVTSPASLQTLTSRTRRDGELRYLEFVLPALAGTYGDVTAHHQITLSSGALRADLVWMRVAAEFRQGRDTHAVEYFGTLNDLFRIGAGEIPVQPLAPDFRINFRMRPGRPLDGTVAHGRSFILTGPRATLDSIRLDAVDVDGNVAESARITISNLADFPIVPTRFLSAEFSRLRSGEKYTLVPDVNLGPVIKVDGHKHSLTVP